MLALYIHVHCSVMIARVSSHLQGGSLYTTPGFDGQDLSIITYLASSILKSGSRWVISLLRSMVLYCTVQSVHRRDGAEGQT